MPEPENPDVAMKMSADKRVTVRTGRSFSLTVSIPQTPDGDLFCKRALAWIRSRAALGKKTAVGFDIDNTLVDARHRTLAAVKRFGVERSVSVMESATLEQIARDPYSTGSALGVGAKIARDFVKYWRAFFFDPENLTCDVPIPRAIEKAVEASDAGAEVFYITARHESLFDASLSQLKRCRLPCADEEHLFTKQAGLSTEPYKEKKLRELIERGFAFGWFLTEEKRDISHLQKSIPEVPCVRLEFPVIIDGYEVDPKTPVLSLR